MPRILYVSLAATALMAATTLAACSGKGPHLTEEQEIEQYEAKEFEPRIDQEINRTIPETEERRKELQDGTFTPVPGQQP